MAVLAAAMLATAAPAEAAEILAPADATELAQTLAEAQEEQDICYGWNVTGDASSTGSSIGGPGAMLIPSVNCEKGFVLFRASVIYECGSCDSGDTVTAVIESSFPNAPRVNQLEDLGYDLGDLAGDDDDKALTEMVSALPLLVAERGLAPFVEFEQPAAADVPASDRPTNSPGSDKLRAMLAPGALGLLLILCGIGWWLYKRGQHKVRTAARTTTPRPTPTES